MGLRSSKPKEQPKKSAGKTPVTDKDRATLQLKRTRDRLNNQASSLQLIIEKEKKYAQDLLRQKRKQDAILVLKKKKLQETMLERARGQLLNVEHLILELDNASEAKKVFDALKVGNDALTDLNNQMNIDDIQNLMDDTAESLRIRQEISEALSQNISPSEMDVMDDEVADLLNSWADEIEQEEDQKHGKKVDKKKTKQEEVEEEDEQEEEEEVEDKQQQEQQNEDLMTDHVGLLPDAPSRPLEDPKITTTTTTDDVQQEAEPDADELEALFA